MKKMVWSARLGRFLEDEDKKPHLPRLEKWRATRQQDLFVLYRKDGTVWNTDCRAWALLGLAAENGRGFGQLMNDGAVRLEDVNLTLPTPLGWRTVISGGGVCFRESNGGRIYPASTSWSPAKACCIWLSDIPQSPRRMQRRITARNRYELLLRRERGKRRSAW